MIIPVTTRPSSFHNLEFSVIFAINTIFTMGSTTFTYDYSSPVAPSRMFKALITDSRTLLPKLLPQFIKEVNVIQGDGEAGSIEQVNFAEG